jgi:hypothetical protein
MPEPTSYTIHTALEVHHEDSGVEQFARTIANLVTADEPRIVDLSHHEDHGNRITLRSIENWPGV